jgi:cell division protein FtsA
LGVILIDVGGGTTDVAVFAGGAIAHTSAIPIGGNNVTRDLARLLRCSFDEAERLKCGHARSRPDNVGEDQVVQVTLASGGEVDSVPLKLVASIIEPRMEEIFSLVRANVIRSGTYSAASAGVVLSGGGSQLADSADVAAEALDDLPVRVGSPRGLTGLVDQVSSPIHATGVGLAVLAAQDGSWAGAPVAPEGAGLVDRLMRWWDRLLPRA